ncbi:MAG: hypothetical protein ACM3PP_01945, partial [Candidatus Saccharibacteria bacterium]
NGEEALAEAFTLLVERIHPLALGNVQRNYLLIRSLAERLLRLRCKGCADKEFKQIIENLTEKMYAHNHMIPRKEARETLGLPVVDPSDKEEDLLWKLYLDFAEDMELRDAFNPTELLHGNRTEFEVISGIVESRFGQDAFIFDGVVEKRDFPEPGHVNVSIVKQSWHTLI